MSDARFGFRVHEERLAVVRLPAGARIPTWARGSFVNIARTPAELSIVCDERRVPAGCVHESGKVALGILGTVPMSTIGVMAELCRLLADARVQELAQLVGLSATLDKYPHEISGGQQQRVALARALAPRPELLLLDEPFSNLDVDLRERLSHEVREIIKASGATAVLVTHDQQEAFAMADEIGVLQEGHIQQWDSPYNLYHRPANRFVADQDPSEVEFGPRREQNQVAGQLRAFEAVRPGPSDDETRARLAFELTAVVQPESLIMECVKPSGVAGFGGGAASARARRSALSPVGENTMESIFARFRIAFRQVRDDESDPLDGLGPAARQRIRELEMEQGAPDAVVGEVVPAGENGRSCPAGQRAVGMLDQRRVPIGDHAHRTGAGVSDEHQRHGRGDNCETHESPPLLPRKPTCG